MSDAVYSSFGFVEVFFDGCWLDSGGSGLGGRLFRLVCVLQYVCAGLLCSRLGLAVLVRLNVLGGVCGKWFVCLGILVQ